MEDTPLIQFGRAERSGPKISHNDALVITALLANYEIGCILIDSGSSADILFGKAYNQMQLGDMPLEKGKKSKEPPSAASARALLNAGRQRRRCRRLSLARGVALEFGRRCRRELFQRNGVAQTGGAGGARGWGLAWRVGERGS
ncbi:UNVERIFIED_CONTAM: hypothetical protein Slati_4268200 [Sesamum latifolium]|uniref:Uncharacterized protein n=1 Tax=Sesamum latifolium TaxID=2727402 RepID=A0AAW2TCW1_9LAMI